MTVLEALKNYHRDFDAAEQVAQDLDIQAVWIADADTARQWMHCIAERLS